MSGPAGTGDTGLGWHVDGDRLVLVVGAVSEELRRELGPTAWSVLETLVLGGELTGVGALVASTNAGEIATKVGVGRDAATKALARLRAHGLIVLDQPRGEGGQFRAARYGISVKRAGEAPTTTRRAGASPRRRMATPTLFDTPTIDTSDSDHDDQPVTQGPAYTAISNRVQHSRASLPQSRDFPHTLALAMRTADRAGRRSRC